MKNNLLVVVLGVHRSGTSAITRGLQVLGVGLGDKLMQPAIGNNDKGFWEDVDFNELNIEMLDALSMKWTYVASIDSADVEVLHQKGYLLRAAELLREKFSGSAIFGFKDPRVAKLLPFWKDVFRYCQLDVRYVLALRHPLSVVRSLSKRDGIEAERSYLLWLDYVFNSLSGSAGDKRVLVDYDLLMQSPDHELSRIAQHLSLEVNLIELQNYKTDFLKQGLRHSVCSLNDLLLDEACPGIVKEMYASLLDVASDKENIDGVVIQDKLASWAVDINRLNPILKLVDRLPIQKTEPTARSGNTHLSDLSGDRAAYEKAAHMFAAEARNEGIALLEELAEKGSSWWEVYNDLAVQYFEANDYARAVPYFKKGIALEGNAGITARNYATVLVMAGALNEALAVLGAILHGHPHDAAILKLICDIAEAKGKEQLANQSQSELEGIEPLKIATEQNEIKIFQIFYDESTRAKVDSNFIPLDNSENLRPDWCEYWPIRNVLLNHSFDEDTYLGFFSPRFFDKTGMDGNAVLEKVRYSDDEVISFSPYFDQAALHNNSFVQGEHHHPGLIEVTKSVLSLLNVPLKLDSLICDQTTIIFSNYFVARYSFWKKWFAYAEKIFAVCEGPDCDLKASLVKATTHRQGAEYAMKVFVIERLVTIVMEELGISSRVAIDISQAPLLLPGSKENIAGLVICDALKGQYRKTGLPVYKDIFFKVRGGNS